jgi:hypothetical protein
MLAVGNFLWDRHQSQELLELLESQFHLSGLGTRALKLGLQALQFALILADFKPGKCLDRSLLGEVVLFL